MTTDEHKEIEVTVHGKVQGVGFRAYTKKHADKIGNLHGYVENQPEGHVEVVAQGEQADLEQFVEYLKRGPYFSEVENIDIDWHERLQDRFDGFSIRR